MLREELIEKISRYFKLMDFEAEKIFDDIFNTVMEGVKNDKIFDLENFGEFIIKNDGQKKSVEFLATQKLDDELNEAMFTSGVFRQPPTPKNESSQFSAQSLSSDIEEELRKKQEAILNKITPAVEFSKTNDAAVQTYSSGNDKTSQETQTSGHSGVSEEESSSQTEAQPDYQEDESKKSFSDYFSVVRGETSQAYEEQTAVSGAEERVISPNLIELHKEIVSSESEKGAASVAEPSTNGTPYYIWYRDSEPSLQETQSLSLEYELLYQAQKEAEYRSKLKIYVTTFILFFSFVLILLIFSPVIYKVFFTSGESQTIETVQESSGRDVSQEQNVTPNKTNEITPSVTSTQQTQTTQQNLTQENKITQAPQGAKRSKPASNENKTTP